MNERSKERRKERKTHRDNEPGNDISGMSPDIKFSLTLL